MRLESAVWKLVGVFPVLAELVVLAAFFGVGEDFVSLVDLLELGLGGFVAGVHVGMIFAGKPSKSLLDIFVGGVTLNT